MSFDFNCPNGGGDGILDINFDTQLRNRASSYAYATPSSQAASGIMTSARIWPLPLDIVTAPPNPQCTPASSPDQHGSSLASSPSPHSQPSSLHHSPFQAAASLLTDWTLNQHQNQQLPQHHSHNQSQQDLQQHAQQQPHGSDLSQLMQDPSSLMGFSAFQPQFQPGPLDFIPATTQAALSANILGLDSGFSGLPSMDDSAQTIQWGNLSWPDLQQSIPMESISRLGSVGSNSPTGTYIEVLSVPSAGEGWDFIDLPHSGLDHLQHNQQAQNAAIFNPSQTLHLRTNSNSSDNANSMELSFEDIAAFPYSPFSPSPESDGYQDSSHSANSSSHHRYMSGDGSFNCPGETISPTTAVAAVPIKCESVGMPSRHSAGSGAGSTSPPAIIASRRNSGPRKSPIGKVTPGKSVVRRISNGRKDGTVEKKVGRRKGPLLPEQRKQASEIRKLRACLRCKYLKKTCDKGEPCGGCQPSHARLWQVPCTRIDIKDIGYFMKDWKADYERHMDRGVSVLNVKGFSQKETLMWITHGYGFALPVMVREVYVADEGCFAVEWVESFLPDQEPIDFEARTEKLDVGAEGVRLEALAEYLDKHIDGPFEDFIDDHFEGTPFITEILKTAHRFYVKERMPVIKKALKLVLAYNLTMHITMVENQGSEVSMDGQIDDEDSKFYGRTKDILEELSALYSGVYSGEKMKNWPTIFMLASILLAVWEEMQFDCHYRVPDVASVNKFCSDMETTPVGVIVGLFHAISQKLPAFTDWDTRQHGHLLHNNTSVCEALTEVRQHVLKHEAYLRTRKETKFDRYDFDSLSNKFLSKLVIRAN
ncbi:hypothetical protein CDD81_947 [Ophiocordyceps australis]|uniref:Zn(2)-C6 fungal-type domain-containing protein n=1 Tax=Ophiocordyceps australis TaxID=1399860 RepID=A0A2C5XBE1_9HYPO|nr:hypothetical protein CDD81_947 [Ophiocordyceps australis]